MSHVALIHANDYVHVRVPCMNKAQCTLFVFAVLGGVSAAGIPGSQCFILHGWILAIHQTGRLASIVENL